MTRTISNIRSGMYDTLRATIKDLNVGKYAPAVPTALPYAYFDFDPNALLYDFTFSGINTYRMRITVLASFSRGMEGAQAELDSYMDSEGSHSIPAALYADVSLGGNIDSLRVTSVTDYTLYSFGERNDYLGCRFNVEILA